VESGVMFALEPFVVLLIAASNIQSMKNIT
jgi:hypothetical protein